MGCVSSTLLNQEEEISQIGGGFSHHIVSLTSTTYGLLTLDSPLSAPKPQHCSAALEPPPPRTTLGSLFPSPLSQPRSLKNHHYHPLETINSWELMPSDHINTFRYSPSPFVQSKNKQPVNDLQGNEENCSPNFGVIEPTGEVNDLRDSSKELSCRGDLLDGFEEICPPNGENRVVVYTTSLRGVRKTFDDCNAVRAAIERFGVLVCERDISMNRGFRDELRELMKGRGSDELIPPRVFVRGRYVGGFEEVMAVVEEECLGELLKGLPRVREGYVCEGCGGLRFMPCSKCNGSCKVLVEEDDGVAENKEKGGVNARCGNCNENGLVLCPVCT